MVTCSIMEVRRRCR